MLQKYFKTKWQNIISPHLKLADTSSSNMGEKWQSTLNSVSVFVSTLLQRECIYICGCAQTVMGRGHTRQGLKYRL